MQVEELPEEARVAGLVADLAGAEEVALGAAAVSVEVVAGLAAVVRSEERRGGKECS